MNKHLFTSQGGIPKIDPSHITTNDTSGIAGSLEETNALAQMAMTGCFNDTYYTDASDRMRILRDTIEYVSTADLVDITIYAKEYGYMKDMPVYLLAYILSRGEHVIFHKLFYHVIRSVKDLRNFVAIMLSGQVGRRSLGYAAKKACQRWMEARSAATLFHQSYGNDPSMFDIIRLVHPSTIDDDKNTLYAWFMNKDCDEDRLPAITRQFLAFCRGEKVKLPNLPLPMLMGHAISDTQWKELALTVSRQTLRMNLNNFSKHGVFKDVSICKQVCDRLVDKVAIEQTRIVPYQFYTAIRCASDTIPRSILLALNDAMELSIKNVPVFPDDTIVALDISHSMNMPITGTRKGVTSDITCADVGALMAATAIKANPSVTILGFDENLYDYTKHINPHDSLLTIAGHLQNRREGTDCSLPLRYVLEGHSCQLMYMISDNESWMHGQSVSMWNNNIPDTVSMWATIRRKGKHKNPLFVCNDLVPDITSPITGEGILHVAGCSNEIWRVIEEWLAREDTTDYMSIIRKSVEELRTSCHGIRYVG